MALKDKVLSALLEAENKSLSGQQLAESFGVSRAAVWKAVNALKAEGHKIEAEQNRGYRLLPESDVLSEAGIARYLADCPVKEHLTVLNSCPSTNTLAKEKAAAGAAHGSVIVAGSQSAGRGRRGHTFYSPDGGLYLSVILRPQLPALQCTFLTLAAAVAVCRAVETVCGKKPGIKWVNDVFLDHRKICGILTEASSDLEGGSLEYAVVGIGLNIWLRPETLPEELRDIAGALYDHAPGGDIRCRLAAEIIRLVYELSEDPAKTLEEYRALSFLPGKTVTVLTGARPGEAKALAITDEGHLLVEFPDGEQLALTAGEVSVREIPS